jgi:hypothetical protein
MHTHECECAFVQAHAVSLLLRLINVQYQKSVVKLSIYAKGTVSLCLNLVCGVKYQCRTCLHTHSLFSFIKTATRLADQPPLLLTLQLMERFEFSGAADGARACKSRPC